MEAMSTEQDKACAPCCAKRVRLRSILACNCNMLKLLLLLLTRWGQMLLESLVDVVVVSSATVGIASAAVAIPAGASWCGEQGASWVVPTAEGFLSMELRSFKSRANTDDDPLLSRPAAPDRAFPCGGGPAVVLLLVREKKPAAAAAELRGVPGWDFRSRSSCDAASTCSTVSVSKEPLESCTAREKRTQQRMGHLYIDGCWWACTMRQTSSVVALAL